MIIILSSNGNELYTVPDSEAFYVEENRLLVSSTQKSIEEAELWLKENGIGDIEFDPDDEIIEFSDCMSMTAINKKTEKYIKVTLS